MYIWNINKLVTALKERTVNDKQRKSYSITFWALVALTVLSLPVVYNPSSMNRYDVIDLFLFIIINVIAIYLLIGIYKKRSRKDLDFFLPFFSLMIPLFLRNILWTTLLTIIGFIYIGFFAPYHSMDETNLIDVIIAAIVEIVMNIMFVNYFKKIYN
jgi:heme/copper-type cytochrome/quinol oxidase subunit 4